MTKIRGVNTDRALEDLCPLSAGEQRVCKAFPPNPPHPECQGEVLSVTKHGILASARQPSGVLVFREWPQRMAWEHEKVHKETPLPAGLQDMGLNPSLEQEWEIDHSGHREWE